LFYCVCQQVSHKARQEFFANIRQHYDVAAEDIRAAAEFASDLVPDYSVIAPRVA